MTNPSDTVSLQQVTAAQDAAVVVDRSDLGLLKFSGATRLDLVHRMSTQDVKSLPDGAGAATVLTTDVGRIIDRLILYAAADHVLVVTGEENARAIGQYMLRFVFYGDDFHVEDLSEASAIYAVYGPQAAARLSAAGADPEGLALHHWRAITLGGHAATLHRTEPLNGGGFLVIGAAADGADLLAALRGAGIEPLDPAAFEYVRIEAGLPRFGRELTQEYIPLEANLWDDVSFSKGCYIGQEIIARMESRGRIAKTLRRLAAAGPITPGAALTAGGKKAGVVTSAAEGPAGWLALGYVRSAALETHAALSADGVAVTLRD